MTISALIIVLYIGIKFFFTQKIDSLGEYAAYIFEGVFVLAVGFYYRKRLKFKFECWNELKLSFLPAVVAGGAAYLMAKPLNITIPFDLKTTETILFLLIIGPILEEFIFRMALWQPIVDLTKKQTAALIFTTLIFSYAHFHAYWFYPEHIHPFIYYQSMYVTVLSLYAGYRLIKTNSIVSPIMVHMGFNLGFFVGSFV